MTRETLKTILNESKEIFYIALQNDPQAKNYIATTFVVNEDASPHEKDFAVILLKRGGKVPDTFWEDPRCLGSGTSQSSSEASTSSDGETGTQPGSSSPSS